MQKLLCNFSIMILFGNLLFAQSNDWNSISPAQAPAARYNHAMSFIENGNVLLYGGSRGITLSDTWLFNINDLNWYELIPLSNLGDRTRHAMCYLDDQKVLLFGGMMGIPQDDTWLFDLSDTSWTELFPTNIPSGRIDHTLTYLSQNKALLFGSYNETWLFDLSDTSWTQLFPATQPSRRERHAAAHLSDNRVLLFGGWWTGTYNNETWIFDLNDTSWTQLNPTTNPEARADHALAYMENNKVLLFGGGDATFFYNETWVYDLDSLNWILDINSTQPNNSQNHAMSETSLNGSSHLLFLEYNNGTWTFGGGDYSLPVELISFSAQSGDEIVQLKWETESESNNLGFIIQRSQKKDSEFMELSSYSYNNDLKGAGNSSTKHTYLYSDKNVKNGTTYWYKLIDVDLNGNMTEHNIISATPKIKNKPEKIYPNSYRLYQNYPNPFNPSTLISFDIPFLEENQTHVKLIVYDVQGRKIRTLYNTQLESGNYSIRWDGQNEQRQKVPAGLYIYRIETDSYINSGKMLLIK